MDTRLTLHVGPNGRVQVRDQNGKRIKLVKHSVPADEFDISCGDSATVSPDLMAQFAKVKGEFIAAPKPRSKRR